MTERGKVFVQIISNVCWTKGWGTTGVTSDPYDEHKVHLNWLVDNGYLFYCRVTRSRGRGRYGQYGRKYWEEDAYGLTKKGWSIAGKYIDASGEELRYQFPYYPTREDPNSRMKMDWRDENLSIDIDDILREA